MNAEIVFPLAKFFEADIPWVASLMVLHFAKALVQCPIGDKSHLCVESLSGVWEWQSWVS
jgi:hypothetical protein